MELDLTKINNGLEKELSINEPIIISKDVYQESEIKDLKNCKIIGLVTKDSSNTITLRATVSGIMVLEDSISLNPIEHQFSCEIEEEVAKNDKKIENTLDITDILWQNIVLEVPLQLTEVEDLSQYQGEGWRLVSEEDLNKENNPFNQLKDMLGEE